MNLSSDSKKPTSIELRNRVYEIIRAKSFHRGSVTLSSGKQSDFYFDMKPTMLDPEGATKLAELILFRLKDAPVERIGGLELGAVPLVAPIGMQSLQKGRPIAGFFVRKKVKEHGTQRLIEGDDISGKNVVILDDVTTTGDSAMTAVRAAQNAGAKVILVLSIVDREEGAEQAFAKEGIRFLKLFTASEFLSA